MMHVRDGHVAETKGGANWQVAVLAVTLAAAVSCAPTRVGGDGSTLDEAIDQERRRNLALEKQVAELDRQLELRIAENEKLHEQLKHGGTIAGVDASRLPHVVKLTFGRYSAAIDRDDDGKDEVVRMLLRTLDQKGRFIPVAGVAKMQVVAVEPGESPTVLAETSLDAEAFDKAYREGLTGPHYTLEAPIKAAFRGDATVKVVFTDAASGAKLEHSGVLPINAK